MNDGVTTGDAATEPGLAGGGLVIAVIGHPHGGSIRPWPAQSIEKKSLNPGMGTKSVDQAKNTNLRGTGPASLAILDAVLSALIFAGVQALSPTCCVI